MTTATSYNGWKNYTTWNINLWLMNDEPLYRACVEAAEDCNRRGVVMRGLAAKHFCQRYIGALTPDGARLSAKNIDWKAIADSIMECA